MTETNDDVEFDFPKGTYFIREIIRYERYDRTGNETAREMNLCLSDGDYHHREIVGAYGYHGKPLQVISSSIGHSGWTYLECVRTAKGFVANGYVYRRHPTLEDVTNLFVGFKKTIVDEAEYLRWVGEDHLNKIETTLRDLLRDLAK